MSTQWFSVSKDGQELGFAAYHHTSDTWFPQIVSQIGELPGPSAVCDCFCDKTRVQVTLTETTWSRDLQRWVPANEVPGAPDVNEFVMPACIHCRVLLGSLGPDAGY